MARGKNGVKFNMKGFEDLRKQPKVRAFLDFLVEELAAQ